MHLNQMPNDSFVYCQVPATRMSVAYDAAQISDSPRANPDSSASTRDGLPRDREA